MKPLTKRLTLAAILAISFSMHSFGAGRSKADTLDVRFRTGQSEIDPRFEGNEKRIAAFIDHISRNYADVAPKYMTLTIYAGASPEGPDELNRRLGEQRGVSLRDYLLERMNGRIENITVINQGARWGTLYNMVHASNEPWKDDVLRILEKHSDKDGWNADKREQQLRKLQRGRVWTELSEKYLKPLRSSGSAVVADVPMPMRTDTIVIRDTLVIVHEVPQIYGGVYGGATNNYVFGLFGTGSSERDDSVRREQARITDSLFLASRHHEPVWALKTNLLLLGAGAPNVEAEFPLGHQGRWSIEGEVFFPWWTWSHNAHAEQALNVGVELRHWLGNRQRHHLLDGWHIGLAVAAGYYDVELRSKGYQGEHLNTYFNIGFQHRWGRRKQWAVDGGLGLGGFFTKYRYYRGSSIFPEGHEERYDDHLMYRRSGHFTWVSACHANVTLAYLFNLKRSKHHDEK